MKNTYLYLPLILLLACGKPESQQENTSSDTTQNMTAEAAAQDSLFKVMMAVHDEVMPEMDRMYRLRSRTTELADSLEGHSNVPLPPDSLRAIAQRIEEAEDAMMNWMRSNKFEFEDMSHEEIMQELETEKENITVVKEKMLSSIEEAEAVLNEIDEE